MIDIADKKGGGLEYGFRVERGQGKDCGIRDLPSDVPMASSKVYSLFSPLSSPTVESRAASVVLTEVPGRGGRCHTPSCPDGVHCRTHTGEPCRQFLSLLV